MARTSPVTAADLSEAMNDAQDLSAMLHDFADRIRKNVGYADDVKTPAEYASAFAGLARSASDAAAAILIVLSHDEQRKVLEAMLRERVAKE